MIKTGQKGYNKGLNYYSGAINTTYIIEGVSMWEGVKWQFFDFHILT